MSELKETREAWLRRAVEVFRPWFAEAGVEVPEFRISVGFGSVGARQENSKILGVTYVKRAAHDGVNEVFISPEDADTASMLATVLHEMIHVSDDGESGHRMHFADTAEKLGFTGPMTSTEAGPALAAQLIAVADALGEYPGSYLVLPERVKRPVGPNGELVPQGPKVHTGPGTQTTRMIKRSCLTAGCEAMGYTIRTTQKWLVWGAPLCPACQNEMR